MLHNNLPKRKENVMNKFIGLGVLVLLLAVGSAATAVEHPAFSCVRGVVEGSTDSHPSFNSCVLEADQPLSNFQRSTIQRYLDNLDEVQLERVAANVLDENIPVGPVNKQEVIFSVLDQVEQVSQPCSVDGDKSAIFCRQYRRSLPQ